MDDLFNNDDLLIRYLDGELNPTEKASLEQRLATDNALQQQLDRLQVAMQAIKQWGTTQKVAGIHQQMMQELKPQQKAKVIPFKKIVRYSMAIAASLLLVFVGVRLYTASQVSASNLYDEAFVDFSASTSRGEASTLTEIEKAYQQKNYEGVTNSSRSLHLDAKDSLLIGLSYLQTDHTTQAISFFEQLVVSKNEYKEDAEFYLALAYLKIKNYEKALPLMQKINADNAHLYHAQFDAEFINKVKGLSK